MVILGIVGIIMGGDIVVENASIIAANFGMSQTLIGLTIVAVGTSLPELVTSIVAARKGESDLALGNVIGSNVFNIVFILGFSSIISPMTVDMLAIYDTVVLLAISALTLVFAKTNKRFSRSEGAVLLAIYVIYFVYILLR
jgi:cation:H+ antiporter